MAVVRVMTKGRIVAFSIASDVFALFTIYALKLSHCSKGDKSQQEYSQPPVQPLSSPLVRSALSRRGWHTISIHV